MAIVSKQVLKSYFEQGDIPTEGQYYNLIESTFNLADTDAQEIQGTLQVAVAEIDVLNLKKAHLPGIGISDAKIGSSFQIGKSLEVTGTASMDHLLVTGGSVSASGNIVTSHITSSGTISGSKISNTHQNLINFYGSVENGLKVESGFVVGPALDIVGGISASGYINGRIHATNITSSGAISSSNITASNIVLKGTSSAAEFALDKTDALGNHPIDVLKYNDVDLRLIAGGTGPYSYEILGAGITLNASGDIELNADGGDIKFKDNLVNKINIQTTDGNITASGFIHSDSNISSSAQVTCEHLFSSDDAQITDDLTVGGDINVTGDVAVAGTGNVALTNGNFAGHNMGHYFSDRILILPTDFQQMSAGDYGLITTTGGGSVRPYDLVTDQKYYASYPIPMGHATRFVRIYTSVNSAVTANVYESDIESGTKTALVSGVVNTDGDIGCVSNEGDAKRYLTVELDWASNNRTFLGGYFTIGRA